MTFSAGFQHDRRDGRSVALAAFLVGAALVGCAGPTAESVSPGAGAQGGPRGRAQEQPAYQEAQLPGGNVPAMTAPASGVLPAAPPSISTERAADRAPVIPPGTATEWPPVAEPGANAVNANPGSVGSGAGALRSPAANPAGSGLTAAGGPGVAAGSPQPAAYTGPQACVLAVRGDSPVARACREGGVRSAKTAMKNLVAQAKANGARFRCDDCHVNLDNYAQLGQGVEDKFNRLLAAAGVR